LGGRAGEGKNTMRFWYRWAQVILHWIYRIIWGLKVKGRENIPDKGGVLVAANHLSYHDPPMVASSIVGREIFFFAKEELFRGNKFFAALIRKLNAIPVTKRKADRRAIRKGLRVLKDGFVLVIFPEGGRNRTDRAFLPPYPGTGYIALKVRVPIVPAYIANTNAPFWECLLRKKPHTVIFGKPIVPDEYAHLPKGMEGAVILSEMIMERIEELARNEGHIG